MITDIVTDVAADEHENNDAEMIISFLVSVSIFLMRIQHIIYNFTTDLQTFISNDRLEKC